ncbi:MAG: iron-sulfur cluster assembly scaffold protein [bacterium]
MSQVQDFIKWFREPEHFRTLDSPDISVSSDSEICGGSFVIQMNIEDGVISDMGFSGSKCGSVLILGALLVEKLLGKDTNEMKNLKREDLIEEMGPYVDAKLECTDMAMLTLGKAIEEIENSASRKTE